MKESERAEIMAQLRSRLNIRDPFQVEHEILHALPDDFVLRYELLWLKAHGRSVGGAPSGGVVEQNVVAPAKRTTRTATSQTETRGGAKSGGRAQGVSTKALVANEAALRYKQRIDRKLRALAREMRAWLKDDDARAGVRRCSVCKRWGEDTWTFCPYDGRQMEEVN